MKNKDFNNYGRLVKHSYRQEWGTGIIKEQRTKEKFDRETGEGGLFVQQYKVWFSTSGEAWYDAKVLLYLPTDTQVSAEPYGVWQPRESLEYLYGYDVAGKTNDSPQRLQEVLEEWFIILELEPNESRGYS